MGVVVDHPEILLLDVPNNGGTRTGDEGEAVSAVVVHGHDVIRRRQPHVGVSQKMERHSGHLDGGHAAQIIACVENLHLPRESQVHGRVPEGISRCSVGHSLQASDGGAGVDDGAAIAEQVELEGRGRDGGEQVTAHADACDLDVVVGDYSRVSDLGGELHAVVCVVWHCSVAEDQRRSVVCVAISVWEAVGEYRALD